MFKKLVVTFPVVVVCIMAVLATSLSVMMVTSQMPTTTFSDYKQDHRVYRAYAYTNGGEEENKAIPAAAPSVLFPTLKQILAYKQELGEEYLKFTMVPAGSTPVTNVKLTVGTEQYRYLTWESGGNVWLALSKDNGLSFSKAVNLSVDGKATNAVALANGKNVQVAWENHAAAKSEIMLSTSQDYGQTFRTYTFSNTPNADSLNPAMAINNDDIFITWIETSCGTGGQIVSVGTHVDCTTAIGGHSRHW